MVYFVPDIILENALKLKADLDQLNINAGEEVVFDFSEMSTFEPAAMLMFSSIIRRFCEQHSEVNFPVENIEKRTYGGTMGFFESTFPGQNLSTNRGKGNENYIPITKIDRDDLTPTKIDNKAHDLAKVLAQDPEKDRELIKLFDFFISEIMQNVCCHAYYEKDPKKLWICGQYWPTKDLAEISVLDEGMGIFKSLSDSNDLKFITNNYEALQWALCAGLSRKFPPRTGRPSDGRETEGPAGFGLYMTSHMCQKMDGVFCMASGENYIEMKADEKDATIGKTSFDGTAIQIRVKPSALQTYKTYVKLNGAVSKEGGNMEAEIRKIFEASQTPSKEEMDVLGIKEYIEETDK